MTELRNEFDGGPVLPPEPERAARVRPHWRRGCVLLAAALAAVGLGVWWNNASEAPQQRAEQHGVLTDGVVTASHTETDSGDHRVCVRYDTDVYVVSVCPWASSAKDTGSRVQVKYLPNHPTTAVIEGDSGSDSSPFVITLWLAFALAVAGVSQVIGRRPRAKLAPTSTWDDGMRAQPRPPSGAVWSPVPDAWSDEGSWSDARTIDWAWSDLGLRGRTYLLRDTTGREVGRVRIGHLGFLRAVSTPRRDYRARTLGIPGRIRLWDAASGDLAVAWYRGRRGVEIEGARPLQVVYGDPVRGQSAEVGFVAPDRSVPVRVRFAVPLHRYSLWRPFPSGSATVSTVGGAEDVVLATLAFQVLAIALSPKGG